MKDLTDDRRNFRLHFGIYLIIVSMLVVLNLFWVHGFMWSLGIALLWGAGVAIHWLTVTTENMVGAWKDFVRHAGVYAIVMGVLGMVNLATFHNRLLIPWLVLVMFWGAGVAIHLLVTATEKRDADGRSDAKKEAEAEQVEEDVSEQADDQLSDRDLQANLNQALMYAAQINQLMSLSGQTRLPTRLQRVAEQVNDWTETVTELAERIDKFKENKLVQQDLESVPSAIDQLEQQLATETDPEIKATLERTLANRRNQLSSLQHLQQMMNRAEIQMESAVSSLGTIYSQLLTSQSANQVANYDHLSAEAEEQTRILQDHLEALEEVKLGKTPDQS